MNNMAELLSSPPDEISELNGVELVRQKVKITCQPVRQKVPLDV